MVKKVLFLCFLFFSSSLCFAQFKSSLKQKKVAYADSLTIDTLSILPNTLRVFNGKNLMDSSAYTINYVTAKLTFNNLSSKTDSLTLVYKTFPVLFSQKDFHKNPLAISPEVIDNSAFIYQPKSKENTLFNFEGIDKSGSISRSIGFGNNQDLSVNSNLVLQMAGKINNEIEFTAAISDDNLPIQPQGNTQQINDFDKVFIQLKRKGATLIAGDYELRKPDSYFMNYFKRTQGAYVSNTFKDKKGFTYKTQVAGAVAKGRSARNLFDGIEGNQGPYRLTGNNGEQYIIVLSGTERIYLDGELLLRGQDNDYVVDYNTAELTFTTKRLITRYSRIVAEFEYSDKVFGRSLYYVNQEFKSERLKIGLNIYNEQDNPNRPFLQNLSTPQKEFLKTVGNNIENAVYPNIDSVNFNDNEVLYKKTDTLGFNDVYVYSVDPLLAKYRVGFSYVGVGKGNYIINVSSAANGRVYNFVPPQNGIPQGDYAPVSLLITPKKQQLITLNADYKISKNTQLFSEIGMSNNDVNLYSDLDNQQNKGLAYKMIFNNKSRLSGSDSTGLKLNTQISYEYASRQFKPLERYRPVEFDRDFNFRGLTLEESAEQWSTLAVQLFKTPLKQVSYKISSFVRSADYQGIQQALNANYQFKTYTLRYDGSLLNSEADSINGAFFKQKLALTKNFKKLDVGTVFSQEHNKSSINQQELGLQSFAFKQYDYFIRSSASKNSAYQFNYITRFDQLPQGNALTDFSKAKTFNGRLELNKNGKSPFSINATYRTIAYLQADSLHQNEETLLGRIEHTLNAFKGFLSLNSFYELGTGQEPKREFVYLEVQAGQGIYAWIDYNNNGIKELNEFEISRFPDQAKFIRVFRPNNEFIRSNFTNINQTLKLNAAAIFKQKKGFGAFFAKFSSISVLRIDKKVLAGNGFQLNPYQTNINESSLVSLNSFFRNTLFFNRANPVWGIDINWQKNGNKALLTNGFDNRQQQEQGLRLRWNFIRKSNFIADFKYGTKDLSSQFFSERNYSISFFELNPEFGYQFNTDFKLSFSVGIKHQKNDLAFGGEETTNSKLGTEIRYNLLKKGTFSAQLNFINNKFIGDNNTAIAYELLDGLQPGSNLTWGATFQRSIANGIQLNFTYEGRKSKDIKTIHTGGLQVRAYF